MILILWKLIIKSPKFDSNYIVYRFVDNDSFLNNLNIGDIFIDRGFVSTTRNPFYFPKNNYFGEILIKTSAGHKSSPLLAC